MVFFKHGPIKVRPDTPDLVLASTLAHHDMVHVIEPLDITLQAFDGGKKGPFIVF
jgi:hypothetical protein